MSVQFYSIHLSRRSIIRVVCSWNQDRHCQYFWPCIPDLDTYRPRRYNLERHQHKHRYVSGAQVDASEFIKLMSHSTAEIFGTVIVSCTPSLWTFWFNIFTKTRLYYSLRSTLWTRSKAAKSNSAIRAAEYSHNQTCHCEQCRQSKRLRTRTSSLELIEQPPPKSTIQIQTVITQSVSGEKIDSEMQRADPWNKEEWRAR